MAAKKTIKRIIAEEYCEKWDIPTHALASKMYNENKGTYIDKEDARSFVRKVRGKHGEYHRTTASNKELYDKEKRSSTPYELPLSYSAPKERFKLPKANKKVLVLSDIHIPYQDNEALEAACLYGLEQGVDTIYLNGDILDFYGLSFHEKDPRKRPTIRQELDLGMQFLEWLRETFPTQTIYFITGNHEKRLERYLTVKAPELLDVLEYKLQFLLNFAKFGIIEIEHGSKVYFGKLLVEHGDKLKGAGGVNPARTLLLKFKRPTLCGHFHRTTSANSKVYDDTTQMAWSAGCLCELEPEYMQVNEHNHGAAIVEIYDNDNFRVNNFQIINGKIY